jgi:hypothetical protein
MESNKYYTPKIEDLFLGYECELIQEDGSWKPVQVNTFQNNISLSDKPILDNLIRTKYLDVEDLNKEIFGEDKEIKESLFEHLKRLFTCETIIYSNKAYYKLKIVYNHSDKMLTLSKSANIIEDKFIYIFQGICLSKNELKKILEWCIKTY